MNYRKVALGISAILASSTAAGAARAQTCDQNPGASCGNDIYGSSETKYATIAGGENNAIWYYGNYSFIGGGYDNVVYNDGTSTDVTSNTICGGYENQINGAISTPTNYNFIGGGSSNVMGETTYGVIAGGLNNQLTLSIAYGAICGGQNNTVSGASSFVGGGAHNSASASYSTVGGGDYNTASGSDSTIVGGYHNAASGVDAGCVGGYANTASGSLSFVGGGDGNVASGYGATIPGGALSVAAGEWSFAQGYYADADQNGCVVFADSSSTTPQTCVVNGSDLANAFVVRATGGVQFNTGTGYGAYMKANTGTFVALSDRNMKSHIAPVNSREVLEHVLAMPVSTWQYRDDKDGSPHMGPMAQDFYAAFQLGDDDRHVTSIDEAGVAFAAIQGVYAEVQQRDAVVASLEKRVVELEKEHRGALDRAATLEKLNTAANQRAEALEQRLARIETMLRK